MEALYLNNDFSLLQARIEEINERSTSDMLHFAVDFYNTHMCATIPAGGAKFQNAKLINFLKSKNRKGAITNYPKAWKDAVNGKRARERL